MNDRQVETALAYLNENAGRYSLEALRGQLLRTGYDPATVDQAIRIHQEGDPAPPKSRTGRKILLVVAVNAALVAIGIAIANLPGITEEALTVLGIGLFLVACAEFLFGLLMCFFEQTRSWGLGLLLGFLLFVGLAFLLLAGFCLYVFANQGAH